MTDARKCDITSKRRGIEYVRNRVRVIEISCYTHLRLAVRRVDRDCADGHLVSEVRVQDLLQLGGHPRESLSAVRNLNSDCGHLVHVDVPERYGDVRCSSKVDIGEVIGRSRGRTPPQSNHNQTIAVDRTHHGQPRAACGQRPLSPRFKTQRVRSDLPTTHACVQPCVTRRARGAQLHHTTASICG